MSVACRPSPSLGTASAEPDGSSHGRGWVAQGRSEVLGFHDRTKPRPFSLNGPMQTEGSETVAGPDGTHLAATRGIENQSILVWDLATRRLVALEGTAKPTFGGVAIQSATASDWLPQIPSRMTTLECRTHGAHRSRIWDLAKRRGCRDHRSGSPLGTFTRPLARTADSWPAPIVSLESRQGVGCGDRPRGLLLANASRTEGSCGTWPSARTASGWPPAGPREFASGMWPAARRRPPGRPIPSPA